MRSWSEYLSSSFVNMGAVEILTQLAPFSQTGEFYAPLKFIMPGDIFGYQGGERE
jgi:hypothetical protein